MLELKSLADIERLIQERLPEGLSLEYKASPALNKSAGGRAELVKDVTAFANSAGGQIIYGISESEGLPTKIDSGVNTREISADWISQVLETSASPRVYGIKIDTISNGDLASRTALFVLTIPAATAFAPHQNSLDKKYYRRFEARSVPMHDYEIRDLLRRGRSPELRAKLTFAGGEMSRVLSSPNQILEFSPVVENVSSEPALYCLFDFLFDKRLQLVDEAGFTLKSDFEMEGYKFHKLQKTTITPTDFPLLWGATMSFGPPHIQLSVPAEYMGTEEHFLIGYSALTSGFAQTRIALLSLKENVISIGDFFSTLNSKTLLGG